MCTTKSSLELKRLLQSLHVYPELGGLFKSSEQLLLFFFTDKAEGFFSPLFWPLIFLPSLLLLRGLLLLVLLELVGFVLSGRLIPRFGGPSVVFKVPCMAWKWAMWAKSVKNLQSDISKVQLMRLIGSYGKMFTFKLKIFTQKLILLHKNQTIYFCLP